MQSWLKAELAFFFVSFFFFLPYHIAYGILVPQLGIEPMPLRWKHRLLTTGPLGLPGACLLNPPCMNLPVCLEEELLGVRMAWAREGSVCWTGGGGKLAHEQWGLG